MDRVRALRGVYLGVEHEDEMVAAFDHCRWGTGGTAPSIDTAMHALVDARHVDHLHPDAVIALAAELGPLGVRVNGVSPDAVVRGSRIFEGGWGEERARVYGVRPEELGKFYAGRTVLGHEVLPEHVAAAVFALCARRPGVDDGHDPAGGQRGPDGVHAVTVA